MSRFLLPGLKPTEEQLYGCHLIESGEEAIKFAAFAGTGKSTSLKLLASGFKGKRVCYIVFNRKMSEEAKESFKQMPWVDVSTAHSIAYEDMDVERIYGDRLKPKISFYEVQKVLGIGMGSVKGYSSTRVVGATLNILNNFLYSSQKDFSGLILGDDFYQEIERERELGRKTKSIEELEFKARIYAEKLWEDYVKPKNSTFPITHDCYLKMWQLSDSNFMSKYDLILFDEAQDANPVMSSIIAKLDAQKVYVGDSHQSIYSWRGTENIMDSLVAKEANLTQSFRFRNNIADIANKILDVKRIYLGVDIPEIKGFEEASKGDGSFVSIHRTNAGCLEESLKRRDVGLLGDYKELIQRLKDLDSIDKRRYKDVVFFDMKKYKSIVEIERVSFSMNDNQMKSLIRIYKKNRGRIYSLVKQIKTKTDQSIKYAGYAVTAHTSKGLEWSHVRLGDDFYYHFDRKATESGKEVGVNLNSTSEIEELNLLYVAATRSQNTIEVNRQFNVIEKEVLSKKINTEENSLIGGISPC